MSELINDAGAESGLRNGDDGPWGEAYQKSIPPFSPNQKCDTNDRREMLEKMPLDTNQQQADYLDAFMEVSYDDAYQDGDEEFDKSESYPYSQKALLGRKIVSELRKELADPSNVGKTFYDLLRNRQRQVEQSQTNFHVTGADGAWTKEDEARYQSLFEQREALLSMADILKETPFLRGEQDSVSEQENFKESYCLNKREIELSRLQRRADSYKETIKGISSDSGLSDSIKGKRIAELKSEIADIYYEMDDIELESDILKDALSKKGEGQTTEDILRSDIDATEHRIEYFRGLMASATSDAAKLGFRKSYKEARGRLKRINAIISDLDEAERRNIRLS